MEAVRTDHVVGVAGFGEGVGLLPEICLVNLRRIGWRVPFKRDAFSTDAPVASLCAHKLVVETLQEEKCSFNFSWQDCIPLLP